MKLSYRIQYGILKGALWVLGCMPVDAASATGGAIFKTIGPLMGISKTARRNMAMCYPQWDAARIENTLRGMWDNLGRVVAEYPHLAAIAQSHRVTFRNAERFEAVRDSHAPAIFIGGHMGNWEIMPPALLLVLNLPMHSVYRAPNNPLVDKLLVGLRSTGGRLRSFGKNRKGLAQTLRALQDNETVGMLIDQKMNTGVEAQFFGHPAMTSTAFVELARKLNCPVVPGRMIRTHGCNFEFDAEPPLQIEGRDTMDVIADAHAVLERWINEHPEQWLWLHRRWKRPN